MTPSNKKIGNDFETKLCDYFSAKGWWAHNFVQGDSGQPCDIIAAKNGVTFLIDAKTCEGNSFVLSRMEENQISSMLKFRKCGNEEGWFAILIGSQIIMASLSFLDFKRKAGVKSVNLKMLKDDCLDLDCWEALYENSRR